MRSSSPPVVSDSPAPLARPRFDGLALSAFIALGLAVVVGVRWAAAVGRLADGFAVGILFGLGLLAVAALGGWTLNPSIFTVRAAPRASSFLIGIAGGTVLIGVAIAVHAATPGPHLAPHVLFLPWATITILVATAEEVVLRGVLFAALQRAGGPIVALVLTAIVFGLIHVPLYGWHVVPLDVGVGLWLGGLRLLSGGVTAPAVAHSIADLATWWL